MRAIIRTRIHTVFGGLCAPSVPRSFRTSAQGGTRQVGGHGLYVMGDVSNLPFREGTFDAILVPHVLYHIPEDEQANTLRQLYSALKDGGICLIIYYWPSYFISKIGELLSRFFASVIAPCCTFERTQKSEATDTSLRAIPPLYFSALDYKWLKGNLPKHWNTEIRSWRSVDIFFTRKFVADNMIGIVLLRIFYWFENVFPHALGRLGRYPMIIIQKRPPKISRRTFPTSLASSASACASITLPAYGAGEVPAPARKIQGTLPGSDRSGSG